MIVGFSTAVRVTTSVGWRVLAKRLAPAKHTHTHTKLTKSWCVAKTLQNLRSVCVNAHDAALGVDRLQHPNKYHVADDDIRGERTHTRPPGTDSGLVNVMIVLPFLSHTKLVFVSS